MDAVHSDKGLTHPFKRLGPPTRVRVTDRGILRIWFLDHHVVLQHIEGYLCDALVDANIRWLGAYLARQTVPVLLFNDFSKMTGYNAAARVRGVDWTRQHSASIGEVHILIGSKLISMAVAVANLIFGDAMKSYNHRDDFDRALSKAILADAPVASRPLARKPLPR